MVLSMEKWAGHVAVVTGASSGCGAAIVEELVKHELIVIGLARRQDKLDELVARCKLLRPDARVGVRSTDIANPADIVAAFAWIKVNYGPAAIIVNSAGLSQPTSLCDGDDTMWKNVLDVNVLGLSIATREAIAHMRSADIAGHVVHINSVLGHYVAMVPEINMYSASKFAVTALTETLRQELMKQGSKIRVTSVSPGPVDTEFTKNFKEEMQEKFDEMPKLLAEDVADAVVYVLSTPGHVQIQEVMMRPLGEPV